MTMRPRALTRLISAAASIAILALGATTPATASTGSGSTTSADIEASRAFMTEFGVPADVQDRLLEDALAGVLSDADDPSATPVEITTEQRTDATFEISRFEDGSIQVVEYEKPVEVKTRPGEVSTMAVTGCSTSGTTSVVTYSGCKVHYRTHVFSYGFYANFKIYTSGNDLISSVSGAFQQYAIGHTRDSWNLATVKQVESSTGPAHARLSITYNVMPYLGQIQKGVRLKVGGNKYWQENS